MQYEFTYNLPVCEQAVDGIAHLSECQPDHDGYVHFKIDEIEMDVATKTGPDQLLVGHIQAWVRQKLEGDEALQAEWDEHVGNALEENPNAGNGTYAARLGRVA
jgi:hypothetical protein